MAVKTILGICIRTLAVGDVTPNLGLHPVTQNSVTWPHLQAGGLRDILAQKEEDMIWSSAQRLAQVYERLVFQQLLS
jgi:hypothetical protein